MTKLLMDILEAFAFIGVVVLLAQWILVVGSNYFDWVMRRFGK